MKKSAFFGMAVLLAGCGNVRPENNKSVDNAELYNNEQAKPVYVEELPNSNLNNPIIIEEDVILPPQEIITPMNQPVAVATIPCSYSCTAEVPCVAPKPEPVILKPRVTETVSKHKTRACCPEDSLQSAEKITVIPEAPEIYVISANRTSKSMINDITGIFDTKKVIKFYVAPTKVTEKDFPAGVKKGTDTIKRNLSNLDNTQIVNIKKNADYIIESSVEWFDTASKKVPAIKYSLVMNANDGKKIGEWNEVVHQADGDRSWW